VMLKGDPDKSWMFCLTEWEDAGASCGESAAALQAGVLTRLPRELEQRGIVLFERSRRPQEAGRIGMLRIIKHR
jgi:hypothetical protein